MTLEDEYKIIDLIMLIKFYINEFELEIKVLTNKISRFC